MSSPVIAEGMLVANAAGVPLLQLGFQALGLFQSHPNHSIV
jgi:hypothetical protein